MKTLEQAVHVAAQVLVRRPRRTVAPGDMEAQLKRVCVCS